MKDNDRNKVTQDIPLVSIGIANYNYAKYIAQALESAANQTYKNCELIIVDDCSTDNSVEVIQNWIDHYKGNFNIKFIKNSKNAGVAKVYNSILERVSGKYYQILDADDLIFPEKIARQVSILEKQEEAALVYSNISVVNENNERVEEDYLQRIGYDQTQYAGGEGF